MDLSNGILLSFRFSIKISDVCSVLVELLEYICWTLIDNSLKIFVIKFASLMPLFESGLSISLTLNSQDDLACLIKTSLFKVIVF